MHWSDWIINPLVGSVIGYVTNWIAIKMLFHPHNEVKLFGKVMPFTPGLIPKGRYRIAKTMGESLSKNILTPEVLSGALNAPEVTDTISNALDAGYTALAANDTPLEDILRVLLGAEAEDAFTKAEAALANAALGLLDNPALQAECRRLTAERLREALRNPAGVLPVEAVYDAVKAYAGERGLAYIQSDAFPAALRGWAGNALAELAESGKTLSELLPANLIAQAREMLAAKTPDIAVFLARLPEQHPGLDESLRVLVSQIAEQNFGRFIGLFINYDSIYDNIKEKLFAYMSEPENQAALNERLSSWLDELLQRDMQSLLAQLLPETQAELCNKLTAWLQGAIGAEQIAGAFRMAEEKAEGLKQFDLYAFVAERFPAFEAAAGDFLYTVIKTELSRALPALIGGLRGALAAHTPASLLARLPEEKWQLWRRRILDWILKAIEKAGPRVVGILKVDKLVEEKMNEFSVAEVETLVFGVVKRELTAITNLGALLGLIIGFAPLVTAWLRGLLG